MAGQRSIKNKDSTGLLLDTVCNALGGIILIVLLIALTASSKMDDLQNEADKARKNNRQQAINDAKKAIAALQEVADKISGASLLAKAINDIKKIVRAHEERDSLVEERDALVQHIAYQNRQIKVLSQQAQFGVHNLRLPAQQDTSKTPLPIIVTKDHAFPCAWVENGKIMENKTSVRLVQGGGGLEAQTVDGGGLNDAGLADYLGKLDQQRYYPLFIVYTDGFSVFEDFKRTAASLNVRFAWKPFLPNEKVLLGPSGKKPPVE